jgi:hypothetical protein
MSVSPQNEIKHFLHQIWKVFLSFFCDMPGELVTTEFFLFSNMQGFINHATNIQPLKIAQTQNLKGQN